jgi:hypothetical protein
VKEKPLFLKEPVIKKPARGISYRGTYEGITPSKGISEGRT